MFITGALRSAGISDFVANSFQPLFINEYVTAAYIAFNPCNVVLDLKKKKKAKPNCPNILYYKSCVCNTVAKAVDL